MKPAVILFAVATIVGLSAGAAFTWYLKSDELPAATPTAGMVGQPRPPFTLGASDGRQVSVSEFDGNVVLINFWATWCTPCRAEMPMLVEMQNEFIGRGFSVVGIALDDVQQAREFAEELGVTYTVLVGGADVMATGVVYGNQAGMLPYTVLIDRAGIIQWTHLGALEHETLVAKLQPLL